MKMVWGFNKNNYVSYSGRGGRGVGVDEDKGAPIQRQWCGAKNEYLIKKKYSEGLITFDNE